MAQWRPPRRPYRKADKPFAEQEPKKKNKPTAEQVQFKEQQSEQKLRGGYYTPASLADFLTRWVAHGHATPLLEPSCGDGAFVAPIATVMGDVPVVAFEVDPAEAAKAAGRATSSNLTRIDVHNEDFLAWAASSLKRGGQSFGAALGNPPFIRYQYLPDTFQAHAAEIFETVGCKFTKHTNAWVPFVLASFALLTPGGRLGMVVPAELIHVMHAQSLRDFLLAQADTVVLVDPEALWFPNTLQGAVLLLAEKKTSESGRMARLGIRAVRDREFLKEDAETLFRNTPLVEGSVADGKWTQVLLNPSTRAHLETLANRPAVCRFDEVASVDVGIVTGANGFFLVPDQVVDEYSLHRWAHPMFGRSEHCPGVLYDESQHRQNASKGSPTNFVWFEDDSVEKTEPGRRYVKRGEAAGLHRRYKCRIRSPWYAVPSVYATEVGLLKRCHDLPRLILNEVGAYTTDTAYRVKPKADVAGRQLVHDFVNPLTALTAELEGRHYGGGVLELVPSEVERLLVPITNGSGTDLSRLDKAIRSLPAESLLEEQSNRVLDGVGVSRSCQDDLLGAWSMLRNRRHRTNVTP